MVRVNGNFIFVFFFQHFKHSNNKCGSFLSSVITQYLYFNCISKVSVLSTPDGSGIFHSLVCI